MYQLQPGKETLTPHFVVKNTKREKIARIILKTFLHKYTRTSLDDSSFQQRGQQVFRTIEIQLRHTTKIMWILIKPGKEDLVIRTLKFVVGVYVGI